MAAQPNRRFTARLLGLSVGVAAIVAGGALTLKPFDSLDALTLFIAGSLVLAGAGEFLTARDQMVVVSRIAGALFIVTGLAALGLRDQTIRVVAVVAGVGLLIGGATRVLSALRGRSDERYVDAVGGLAGIAFGLLALAWRDVTILVVATLVGPVAVIFGVAQLMRAFRGHPPPEFAGATRPGRWHSRVHRAVRVLRATGALIIALALVAVSNQFHRGSPSVDAFYSAPDDLPDTPGQLVRNEAFDRALPDNARAARILFTTTALDGSVGVASALVIVPTAEPAGPWPVLLWEHGTTGVAEPCAPSNLADPLGSGAMPARQQAIDNGWVIVAPDYIGLGTQGPHPYLIGVPTARSSLDAVRAARQIDDLSLSDQTVVWGHSQGGGAALWVGIEAQTYAPDVPLLGIAAMAPASDLPSLATVIEREPIGMLFGSFILDAYSKVFPDVRFDDYVRASARAVLEASVERCLSEPATVLSLGAIASGENVFGRSPTDGPLAARLAENVPDAPSGVPTFLGQGAADPLISPDAQAGFVAGLCAAGQVVEYHTYAGRDHLSVVADDSPMIPDLVGWTQGRFAGQPPPSACTTAAH
jgi:uncharacterized membrane protein HdeD (DUF308 family)/alpha-beta hydrolase superfamily lysophospholipase